MYHKKPDKQTETLAEWISQENKDKATRDNAEKFEWHKSKYKPPVQDIKEAEVKLEDEPNGPMRAPIAQVPNIKQYEKTFTKKDDRMTKNGALASKLTDQKYRIQDDILKIDTKIINPIGISDYQAKLLTAQRNAMMVVLNILNLRIADLSVEDDENE